MLETLPENWHSAALRLSSGYDSSVASGALTWQMSLQQEKTSVKLYGYQWKKAEWKKFVRRTLWTKWKLYCPATNDSLLGGFLKASELHLSAACDHILS